MEVRSISVSAAPAIANTHSALPGKESGADSAPCAVCGASNEPWAMLCSGCGRGLGETVIGQAQLEVTINGKSFPCANGDVLGREGTVGSAELWNFGAVHRRHVQILLDRGVWHVQALANTRNLTELDGSPLARGERRALCGEHQLRLSTQVRIGLRVRGVDSSA